MLRKRERERGRQGHDIFSHIISHHVSKRHLPLQMCVHSTVCIPYYYHKPQNCQKWGKLNSLTIDEKNRYFLSCTLGLSFSSAILSLMSGVWIERGEWQERSHTYTQASKQRKGLGEGGEPQRKKGRRRRRLICTSAWGGVTMEEGERDRQQGVIADMCERDGIK